MAQEYSTHIKRRRNRKAEDRKVNKFEAQVTGWVAQNEKVDNRRNVQAQYDDNKSNKL